MRAPTVSVVVPFHNQIEWLAEAVKSVVRQTYSDFELVLVDDGSTADLSSLDLDDERIRLIRQGNRGVSIARNHGVDVGRGEYVAFLDADDRWLPHKLERQLAAMDGARGATWSHTSYRRVGESGEFLETIGSGSFSGDVFPEILFGCPIHTSSVMARRSVFAGALRFESVGGEDPLLWARFAQESAVLGIDDPLVEVRVHEASHWRSTRAQIIARRSLLASSLLEHPDVGALQRRRLVSRMELEIAALHLRRDEVHVIAPHGHHGRLQAADYPYLRRSGTHEAVRCVLRALRAWPANPAIYRAISGYVLRAASPPGPPPPGAGMTGTVAVHDAAPTVSVVTPLYNSSAHIERTLNGLVAQTCADWEAILVDDGSVDDTGEKVRPYLGDPRFTYVRQPNAGIAGARNTGLRAARGRWVCLLDHDDHWLPHKLEAQLEQAAATGAAILCSDAAVVEGTERYPYSGWFFPDGLNAQLERSEREPVDMLSLLLRANFVCASSAMIDRRLFTQHGLLDPAAAPADDFDFWLRCLPEARLYYSSTPLLEYGLHGANFSLDYVRLHTATIRALRKSRGRFAGDPRRLGEFDRALAQYSHLTLDHIFAGTTRSVAGFARARPLVGTRVGRRVVAARLAAGARRRLRRSSPPAASAGK